MHSRKLPANLAGCALALVCVTSYSHEVHLEPGVTQSSRTEPVSVNNGHSTEHKFRMMGAIANDNYDDPIKYPGQEGRAHHHTYVGNGFVDHHTTNTPGITHNRSLQNDPRQITRMSGAGGNRTGYWVPTMYYHGPDGKIGTKAAQADDRPMTFGFNQIYYTKSWNVSDEDWEANVRTMPQGLKIITNPESYVFNCGYKDDPKITHYTLSGVETGGDGWVGDGGFIPRCDTSRTNSIGMRITFPNCWDGVNLTDKDDDGDPTTTSPGTNHDHMSKPERGTGACPASHPVLLPVVQYVFSYPIVSRSDDTSKYYLSSDVSSSDGFSMKCPVGRNGCTNHGDWMNGWEPTLLAKIVDPRTGCLGTDLDHCASGRLDNDEKLALPTTQTQNWAFGPISFNYKFKFTKPILLDLDEPARPEPPVDLRYRYKNNGITLQWRPGASDAQSYTIVRDGQVVDILPATARKYRDMNVEDGRSYVYVVKTRRDALASKPARVTAHANYGSSRIELSGYTMMANGARRAVLVWSGIEGNRVTIMRNGREFVARPNTGRSVTRLPSERTFRYQVCDQTGTSCSSPLVIKPQR